MTHLIPLRHHDGYLPIEDHGLIGDGTTAALVGRDGSIPWLCVPRFDSPPLFCGILDARRGGAFTIAPEDLVASRQYYIDGSGVLVTELQGRRSLVRVTDALTLRRGASLNEDVAAGRQELLRRVEVLEGPVRLRVELQPYGATEPERRSGGICLHSHEHPDLDLHLISSLPLEGLRGFYELETGARHHLLLEWHRHTLQRHQPLSPDDLIDQTIEAWHRWQDRLTYDGPRAPLVRRSAITLKMLDYMENGAIVAAPTSSLPEALGGPRNWDYRYAWLRDAAFSVYALNRISLRDEERAFLGWVLDVAERDGRPRVLYTVDGAAPAPEREDPSLEGYRRSAPVRWGNAAADQHQHDVFGEVLDCAYQWMARGGEIDAPLWERLRPMVEAAAREWRTPDQGIWEVRTGGRPFTYSAALCQVAVDRGARIAERYGYPGDTRTWRALADTIRAAILKESWSDERHALTQHLGGGDLDASLLALPIRHVLPADHPRMVATTRAIAERLSAGNGLLYRYIPDQSPDGLPGDEGAFLLCSFWLVDNLTAQGRLDEAMDLYNALCDRANPLGLLPEEVDPSTGAFLGNFPQAISHVGLISSGVNLAQAIERRGGRTA